MGKTRDTGFLTDCVFTDSSNNVGIGAAASGSYKLQVTGTSNFTSTINGAGVSLSDTLNGTTANFTSSVTGNYFIVSPAAFTAQSGGLRLGSQVAINARNAANSADITLITTNSSDGVAIRNGALNINSSGNVGIGTSSPTNTITLVAASSNKGIDFVSYALLSNVVGSINFEQTNDILSIIQKTAYSGGALVLGTNSTERMRITSGGQVLINSSSVINTNTAMLQVLATNGASVAGALVVPSGAAGGVCLNTQSVTSAGTGWYHFVCQSGNGSTITTNNMLVYGNGNIANANNSYGQISDIRLKKDVVPATSKLQDLLKVNIVNFKFIDDETETKQLGVIAQELEEIFPTMIDINKDGLKSVKYSIFVPMLVKAIQEQQDIINELSAKVEALENKA